MVRLVAVSYPVVRVSVSIRFRVRVQVRIRGTFTVRVIVSNKAVIGL